MLSMTLKILYPKLLSLKEGSVQKLWLLMNPESGGTRRKAIPNYPLPPNNGETQVQRYFLFIFPINN